MDRVVKELLRLPAETAKHRAAISRIATKRRELAGRLGEAIGPTKAAQKLGVSRQTFWQILNPDQAKEIKKRSKTNTGGALGSDEITKRDSSCAFRGQTAALPGACS